MALRYMAVPAFDSGVLIIPGKYVNNGDERLVVLNTIVFKIVKEQRAISAEHIFTNKGAPITRTLNSAWIHARKLSKPEQVRVHGLKHIFGH